MTIRVGYEDDPCRGRTAPRSRTRTGRAEEEEYGPWPKDNEEDESWAEEDDDDEPSAEKEEGELWADEEEDEDDEP